MNDNRVLICLAALTFLACDSESGSRMTAGGTNPTPGGSETGPVDPTASTPTTGQPPADSDGGPMDSGMAGDDSTSSDFIAELDAGPTVECDVWEQDCPSRDEKCVAWASDGGITWTGTRCVPVMENAGQAGDTCVAEGGGLSGIDDCGHRAMCWNVDPETSEGTCVALCGGSPENPQCDDTSTECSISLDGVLTLCLPSCDPLLQDCPVDIEACYPGVDGGFQCYPDYSGEMGAYGDPCEYTNVCNPGLFCGAASLVPGCTNALCCSEFCDITQDDPNSQCAGAGDGQQCLPWFAEGAAPPGQEVIGYCGLPA